MCIRCALQICLLIENGRVLDSSHAWWPKCCWEADVTSITTDAQELDVPLNDGVEVSSWATAIGEWSSILVETVKGYTFLLMFFVSESCHVKMRCRIPWKHQGWFHVEMCEMGPGDCSFLECSVTSWPLGFDDVYRISLCFDVSFGVCWLVLC